MERRRLTVVALALLGLAAFLYLSAREEAVPVPVQTKGELFSGEFKVTVLGYSTGEPVSSATINYSTGEGSGSVFTDGGGVALLPVDNGGPVSMTVTSQGFETQSLTVLAKKGAVMLRLKTREAEKAVAGELVFSAKGSIFVSLQNEEGEPVSGRVALYDYRSGQVIEEQNASGGNAFFEVGVGREAYVVVEAEGYLYYNGLANPIEISGSGSFKAVLERVRESNAKAVTIRTVDAEGGLVPAVVHVLSEKGVLLTSKESNGELALPVSKMESFYALAYAEGRLPARSKPFIAGEEVVLALYRATEQNSFALSVKAENEFGKGLKARVIIKDSKGIVIPSTQFKGGIVFALEPGSYEASITAVGEKKEEEIKLSKNTEALFVFLENSAFIDAGATNPFTGESVHAAAVFGKKECVTPCRLQVEAGKGGELVFSADGFVVEQLPVPALNRNTAFKVNADMTAFPTNTFVEPLLLTENNEQPVSVVRPGAEYVVVLSLTPEEGGEQSGAYLRVGENARIIEYPASDTAFRSTSYAPGKTCGDLAEESVEGDEFKWVEVRFNHARKRSFRFKVRLSDDADKLELFYRGYSNKGGAWSRDPFDPVLGAAGDGEKAGCYAETRRVVYGVAREEPLAAIYVDEEGEIFSDVEQIVLEANAVFPADAKRVELQKGVGCTLLYSIESDAGTAGCYDYDDESKVFEFKSGDVNPADCPTIKVTGNLLASDDSARLVLAATCTDKEKTIPISLASSKADSLEYAPKALSAGNLSAKLVYLINNKQLGPRKLDVGGKTVSFNKPSAKAIAWNGPGELAVSEGGETLYSIPYNEEAAYFEGVGGMGPRTDSCSNWLCCASEWCNPAALAQAITAFKGKAVQEAGKTVLARRGNLKPFAEEFSFVTVAQVVEGASSTLSREGFTGVRGGDKPVVYELKASTRDGEEWVYSVRVLEVFNVKKPGNEPELEGFVHGDGEEVEVTEEATLVSMDQASDEHHQAVIPVPSFFVSLGGPLDCSAACSGSIEMVSLPGIFPTPKTSVKHCKQTQVEDCVDGGCEVCSIECDPIDGDVQVLPFGNRVYVVIRMGLDEKCNSQLPSLQGSLVGVAAYALKDELGGMAGLPGVGATLMPAANNPAMSATEALQHITK